MKKSYSGFTLIELLVVISVIAILSTLTVVYLETARMTARDARRISDVKQIQLALKMYYNDVGMYPTYVTTNSSIANGGTNYLLRVPSNPVPRNDNGCTDQDYQYTQLEAGQGYNLNFCLGDKTDDLDGGIHSATHNGILNCPTGYVAVPGSSTYNTNDFCVMKYEAKCADNLDLTAGLTDPASEANTYPNEKFPCTTADNTRTVVSVATGYPIGLVTQDSAQSLCQGIGGHLMTNAEWMTIANNIEQLGSNWVSGVVGDSYLYKGNYGNSLAADATTENICGNDDCKRTFNLSNGEKIWDFSGNVGEVLADVCHAGSGQGYYEPSTGSFVEWNDGALQDYELTASGPALNPYTSTQKIGQYYGCSEGAMFIRGGWASQDAEAGIFGLYLEIPPFKTDSFFGFRCVK